MGKHMQEKMIISLVVNGHTSGAPGKEFGAEADVELVEHHFEIDDESNTCSEGTDKMVCGLVNITGFGRTNKEAMCNLLVSLTEFFSDEEQERKTKGVICHEDGSHEETDDVFAANRAALKKFLAPAVYKEESE